MRYSVDEILSLQSSLLDKDVELIKRASNFSKKAHEGQKRFTGEPYFCHTFETAKNLAMWQMDGASIAAGFLHDTVEDGRATEEEIEREFGGEILGLIQGVTKLGTLRYRGVERHAESLRKFFVATAKDVRVLIIKLADRLHNIQTLHGHTDESKRKKIALETIELYAPLAYRLGMGELKGELEDHAFPYVYPKEYKEVQELLKQKAKQSKVYLQKIHRSLQKHMAKHYINDAKIDYRKKHTYSLYKKLLRRDMNIDNIYDIMALRIIVSSVEECYRTLGIIHQMFKPVPGKIKDYIANPKSNGYQSLHTTIFTGYGGIVEIQIRTQKIHEESEYGAAGHLLYKDKKKVSKKKATDILSWLSHLKDLQDETVNSQEFIDQVRADIFHDSIFVMTPKGDVVELPEGARILDFAYAIHSDIGDHAQGATVNGKYVSLETKLENSDIVDISTNKKNTPTYKWLEFVTTNIARRHIRSYLTKNNERGGK